MIKKLTFTCSHEMVNVFFIWCIYQIKKFISGVIAIKIPGEKNSFTTKEIFANCKKLKIKCVKQKNIKSANQYLFQSIKPERIVVTGSLYLVGKVRKLFI